MSARANKTSSSAVSSIELLSTGWYALFRVKKTWKGPEVRLKAALGTGAVRLGRVCLRSGGLVNLVWLPWLFADGGAAQEEVGQGVLVVRESSADGAIPLSSIETLSSRGYPTLAASTA